MIVVHYESGIILGKKIQHAKTFYARLRGLMFREKMGEIDGMLIEPCNSIHNFFVRFPIDVLFLDKNNKVVKVLRNFKPWRVSLVYFSARKVLELPSKSIPDFLKKGDTLEIKDV